MIIIIFVIVSIITIFYCYYYHYLLLSSSSLISSSLSKMLKAAIMIDAVHGSIKMKCPFQTQELHNNIMNYHNAPGPTWNDFQAS